jgi:hypothetical protein
MKGLRREGYPHKTPCIWQYTILTLNGVVDDKKNPATEDSLKKFSKQLRELFVDDSQHNNFRTRLDIALAKDPTLCLEIAELRSALGRLP